MVVGLPGTHPQVSSAANMTCPMVLLILGTESLYPNFHHSLWACWTLVVEELECDHGMHIHIYLYNSCTFPGYGVIISVRSSCKKRLPAPHVLSYSLFCVRLVASGAKECHRSKRVISKAKIRSVLVAMAPDRLREPAGVAPHDTPNISPAHRTQPCGPNGVRGILGSNIL